MDLVVRATVVFWLLWLLLRAAGKRELAEMTPFELILLMVVGDLVQQGVNGDDQSTTGAALSITTIMLWTVGVSYAAFRWPRLRNRLESAPTVLVRDGAVDERALKVQRVALDDLYDEARLAGVSDISEVAYGVLESDGKISFLRRVSGSQDDTQTQKADNDLAT